jgi:hypothetical protein
MLARHQDRPDDGRIEEHRHGEPEAHLLKGNETPCSEPGEHGHHDQRGPGEEAPGAENLM